MTFELRPNHLWTVPVEFVYYLILPFVAFGADRVRRTWRTAAGIGALLAYLAVTALVWPPKRHDAHLLPCFGTLAAHCARFLPPLCESTASLLAGTTFFALLGYLVWYKSGRAGDPTVGLTDKRVELSAFWAVFTYSVYARRTIWARMLSFKPLMLFGLTIYSTYLFHWIVIEWFAMRTEWCGIPLSIAAAIAAGHAGHLLFERPLYAARVPISLWVARTLGFSCQRLEPGRRTPVLGEAR